MPVERKRLRVFYATGGPQDVVEAYRQEHLGRAGRQPLVTDVSVPYANQLLEACTKAGASVWVVSPHPRLDRLEDGAFRLEHRPRPGWCQKGGLAWHLGIIGYQVSLMASALRYRANVAVIGAAYHYWLYALLRPFGVRIVPVLHCTFWPAGFRRTTRASRIVDWLNGRFWKRHVFASVVVSDECGRQIREIAGDVPGPILVAMPLFRRGLFAGVPEPPAQRRPFTVTFAGRVERNKGVFDLLEVAATLERRERGRFVFEVCGSGSALEELKRAVVERRLTSTIRVLGWLDRERMVQAYGRSHVVITPTTSSFEEGFCQVSAEAVLAGRPLVASRVCPAVEHLGRAVIEVQPGDIAGFADAIWRLADDPEFYEEKRSACPQAAGPFYEWDEGLGGRVLGLLLRARGDDRRHAGPPACAGGLAGGEGP